jgi:spore germination protein
MRLSQTAGAAFVVTPGFGETAGLVAVMTYDEHWFGCDPAPIVFLPWVKWALNYSVSRIPKKKMLLVIPAGAIR